MSTEVSNTTDDGSEKIKLRSLTPTDQAENGDFYCRVLKSALDDQKHYNIALTGGYGSGKSSVIETFLRKHNEFKPIRISLAAFNFADNDAKTDAKRSRVWGVSSDINNEQIELEISLLQQFLYQSETWEKEKEFFFLDKLKLESKLIISIIGIFVFLISFKGIWNSNEIWKWFKMNDEHYILIFSVFISCCCLFFLLSSGWFMYFFFKLFQKIKTAKIDIQPISFEVSQGEKISILSTYLFEIVKLFKNSDYNLVILEDIDRLENHELFEKLREINNILRYNPDTSKKKITFIYSLKESVFKMEKDKNKFFDIIIPVVPYVNHLNSKDKLGAYIREIEPNYSVKLKEVVQVASLCIDDMRTIANISNEYTVYKTVTGSKDLDPEKLLAIIIYKNIFPSDFEKIHSGNSELQKIFDKRQKIINEKKKRISDQISDIESELELISNEEKVNINDLREQYIMGFLKKLEEGDSLSLNGNAIPVKLLLNDENFELIKKNGLTNSSGNITKFNDIEKEINSNFSYSNRVTFINNKADQAIKLLEKNKTSLKSELTRVDSFSFSKLISGEKIFNDEDYGIESQKFQSDKFKYDFIQVMLAKGYITPDYKYWISLMHEGSLSPNDRQFIFSIKNNISLSFDRKLDDSQSVINELFPDDWTSLSVLNFDLFNFTLKHNDLREKLIPLYESMKSNLDSSLNFVSTYFDNSTSQKEFVSQLLVNWDDFIFTAIQKKFTLQKFIPSFLIYVDNEVLSNQNALGEFEEYLNNSEDFLSHFKDVKLSNDRTKKIQSAFLKLNVKFNNLKIESPSILFDAIYKVNAYSINLYMIQNIIDSYTKDKNIDISYTTIMNSDLLELKQYVSKHKNQFISDVLIVKFTNSGLWEESKSTVLSLLNDNDVNDDNKKSLIESVDSDLINFSELTSTIHWSDLIQYYWIKSDWKNLLDYFDNFEEFDEHVLALLNDSEWISGLVFSKDSTIEHSLIEEFIKEVLKQDIQREPLENLLRKYAYYITSNLIDNETKIENIRLIIDIGYFRFNIDILNVLKMLEVKENIHLHYMLKFQDEILKENQAHYFQYNKQEFIYILKEERAKDKFLYSTLIENTYLINEFKTNEEGNLLKKAIERSEFYVQYHILYKTMSMLNSVEQISFFNSIMDSGFEFSGDELIGLIQIFNGDISRISNRLSKTSLPYSIDNLKFSEHLKTLGLVNKIQEDKTRGTIKINRNNKL